MASVVVDVVVVSETLHDADTKARIAQLQHVELSEAAEGNRCVLFAVDAM